MASMMTLRRRHGAPADPVAAVIDHGQEVIITEPIALMREMAITGRDRDDAWLDKFIRYAHTVVPGTFAEADIHQVSCCWPLDADRVHAHITLV
jgi:hypothetical protein